GVPRVAVGDFHAAAQRISSLPCDVTPLVPEASAVPLPLAGSVTSAAGFMPLNSHAEALIPDETAEPPVVGEIVMTTEPPAVIWTVQTSTRMVPLLLGSLEIRFQPPRVAVPPVCDGVLTAGAVRPDPTADSATTRIVLPVR